MLMECEVSKMKMKQAVISAPIITADTLAWLKSLCDIPPKATDSAKQLRWKAAQRDVYLKAKHFHELATSREGTAKNTAENLNIKVRSED